MERIYLIGIGGIAMANLACLLKSLPAGRHGRRFVVSGSDIDTFGPSAELLKKNKIKYFKNHNPKNIKKFKPDLVIIGNAIKRGNPSLEYILNEQISYCSMPEAIRKYIIGTKKSIVIAGTSGKTTTTAIASWILEDAGLKPTALIGGTVQNLDSGFLAGDGKYVVIEGDEYNSSFYDINPKFIHYLPYHAIITNVQEDHLDIYGHINNIVSAFKKIPRLIPSSGSLILNKNNRYTKALSDESKAKIITFGKGANIEAKGVKYNENGISFDIISQTKTLGKIDSPLPGDHNTENILSAIALALSLKIDFKKIASAISKFKGVKRRLEIIYKKNNLIIIDDFAHNPDKVSASLSALRKHFPNHKIIAIFEPRTGSSRKKFFQNAYIPSFKQADIVYIAESYNKSALNKKETFSNEKLASDLNKKSIETYALNTADNILDHLSKRIDQIKNKPTVIIVMTSGEFDGIHQKLKSLFS